MSVRPTRFGLGLVACLLLPSCALNTIRLDRATAMGQAGKTATGETRKVFTDVQSTNRDVLIELAAVDPNCDLLAPVIPGGATVRGELLCTSRAATSSDFTVKRWRKQDFAASLAVIEGLTAYLGAVDAIIARKPVDLAEEVAGAKQKLETLADTAATVAGAPKLPALSAEQSAAIKSTLDLIGPIVDEQNRVDDLRDLEKTQDEQGFAATIAALHVIDKAALDKLEGQLSNQQIVLKVELARMADANAPTRRPTLVQLMLTTERIESLPDLRAALDKTVTAFADAHRDYRALLVRNSGAKLTAAEQRKKASIVQAHVLAALSSLTEIIKAF